MRRNKANIGYTLRRGIINPSNFVNSIEVFQKKNTINRNTNIKRKTFVTNNINNNLKANMNVASNFK